MTALEHQANHEISLMSETSNLMVEAVKALGIERIDNNTICSLKNRLPENKKKKLLQGP